MRAKGKLNPNGPKAPPAPVPISAPNPDESDVNKEDEFSIQLNWCLTNLKAILRKECTEDKKVPDRKVVEASRVYNSLADPKTSYIKKRQLMANYFGDYRKQMVKEEEKFRSKSGQLKIANCLSGSKIPSKPVICRKREKLKPKVPSEPFKFNFPE